MTTESGLGSGIVVVDKPAGMTSHDVVARIRRLAVTRKVGHAGTLDPMATGVLVLGLNRATRLLGHLMLTEKTYDATVRLGESTTTDDAEGEVLATAPADGLDEGAVRDAFARYVGEIDQVPTAVSAVKVDGRRAYQRVRAGEQVELEPRRVMIHDLIVHEVVPRPLAGAGVGRSAPRPLRERGTSTTGLDARISVRCSSGTYIRAIARDVGRDLGVGGHLTALRRTAVGPYGLAVAHTLDELTESFSMLPIADAARAAFPAVDLDANRVSDVRHGRPVDVDLAELTALFAPDGGFLALYEPRDGRAKPVAVFV